MTELRSADAIAEWVAGGLALARAPAPSTGNLGKWLSTVLSERPGLPPIGCVADLATLATEGHLGRFGGALPDEPGLKRGLRGWDDILGRIAGDARLSAVHDAIAGLPADLRAQAAGLFASLVLGRVCGDDPERSPEIAVVPAVIRRCLKSPEDRSASAATTQLLVDAYERLVRRAESVADLLGPADAFLLTWIARLGSLEARVLLAQLAEAAEATVLPRRVRSGRVRGSALSRLEEESAYPVGGFSGISTSGSLENLLTTELVWMTAGGGEVGGDDPGAVDLFELRWAEGELLYYTRERGRHHRSRRAILVVLDGSLALDRTTAVGSRQRVVVVLGGLVAVLRRCAELLGDADLHIRVVVEGGKLALETEVLELLLLGLVQRGVATVGRASSGEAASWAAEQAARGATDCVVIGAAGVECAPLLAGTPGRSPILQRVATRLHTADDDPVDLLTWLV